MNKKIIFLLPPSEGKNSWIIRGEESLSFHFPKPCEIATQATQKDLKCQGARYDEGISYNTENCSEKIGAVMSAIERYSGVMYNAISYETLWKSAQQYFKKNFLILSGMYGLLAPKDMISNYKLPIETKGLYAFWGSQITESLNSLQADYIVDFLPLSYKKMIKWKDISSTRVQVDFYSESSGERKKLTHGVKKIKGNYIHTLCEKQVQDLDDFSGEIIQVSKKEYHISVISDN